MSAQKRIYTKYYNKNLIPKDQIGNKYKNKKARAYKIGMKYHNKKGNSLKIWGGNKYYIKKKIGNRQHVKKSECLKLDKYEIVKKKIENKTIYIL